MKLVTLPRAVLVNADCVGAMAVMAENSVDAIVTDPPYGLRFMGKGWDDQGAGPQQRAWHARWVTQALRVLKPGGHMLAFGGSRTVQHLAVAAEDCGFEIRDTLMWVYGSGMGLGSRAKPAHEPISLARKPFPGSVAANVQTWGVGALNIDGCRIGADARWPANFLHDGSPEVIDLLPGGAASFFYCAKAQTGEREYGTSSLPERTLARSGGAQLAEARGEDYEEGQGIGLNRVQIRRNIHPTVKPVELLAYLQRLVTPPGGLVLDPFAGSGSAGIAAAFEGFQYVGMELDTQEGYFGIAAARIAQAQEDAAAGLTWEQALKKDKAARGPRVDAPEDAG